MLEQVEFESSMVPPLRPAESYTSCSLHDAVKIRTNGQNLTELNVQTIPQFFHERCQKYKDLTALAYETPQGNSRNTEWTTVTYAEYEQNVEQTALLLLHLGVKAHTSVGILAFNCPEWFYAEFGALRIGAVVAGIYTTNSSEAVYHALELSDATVCLVDDAQQMSKVRAVKSRLNQLRAVVQLNGPFDEFVGNEPGYYRWKDLFEMQFSSTLREELLLRERDVVANECALLIFTSGTVGMPKGVMISHDAVLFNCHLIEKKVRSAQSARAIIVSYLPLNHIAAQLFDAFMTLGIGGLIHFADRNALKGSMLKTYAKTNANVLFGVPRVYEKLQEDFEHAVANCSGLRKFVIKAARNLMESYHLNKMENKSSSLLKYWLASKVVHGIKAEVGIDQVQVHWIGGAPVTEELKKFFLGFDLQLVEIYGMSEASGGMSYSFGCSSLKTVGKALEGINIKINNPNENGEGEIFIRGRSNFMGYLKNEEKTLETLTEDGWIRSGDMGYLDDEENLYICGRIKELVITAGGENIPAVHIESLIKKELPCVSNALVVGDNKKYLTVLLTLKVDIDPYSGYPLDTLRAEAREWLESVGVHYTHVSDLLNITIPENLQTFDVNTVDINCDSKVWQALEEGIKRYNNQAISNAQKVQYFTVLPHDFSIPTNELGPTLKIKRNVALQKYAKIIDKMYAK